MRLGPPGTCHGLYKSTDFILKFQNHKWTSNDKSRCNRFPWCHAQRVWRAEQREVHFHRPVGNAQLATADVHAAHTIPSVVADVGAVYAIPPVYTPTTLGSQSSCAQAHYLGQPVPLCGVSQVSRLGPALNTWRPPWHPHFPCGSGALQRERRSFGAKAKPRFVPQALGSGRAADVHAAHTIPAVLADVDAVHTIAPVLRQMCTP